MPSQTVRRARPAYAIPARKPPEAGGNCFVAPHAAAQPCNTVRAASVVSLGEVAEPKVSIDKLAVSWWYTGDPVSLLEALPGRQRPVERLRVKGQGFGYHTLAVGQRASGRAVYVQVARRSLATSWRVRGDFNPSRHEDLSAVIAVLRALGLSSPPDRERVSVDHLHVAYDYAVPISRLVLDLGTRKMHVIVGADGIETCRPLNCKGRQPRGQTAALSVNPQLYDKALERRGVGVEVDGDLTRYELQIRVPEAADLPLRRLPQLSHPGAKRAGTLRLLRWLPESLPDPVTRLASAAAPGLGVRSVLRALGEMPGLDARDLEGFRDTVVAEVEPSPAEVWSRAFPALAERVVDGLVAGL